MKVLIYSLLMALIFWACSAEEEGLTNQEILSISGLDADTYFSDNFTGVTIIVTLLPREIDTEFRTIKFESEGGTFQPQTVVIPKGSSTSEVTFIPGLAAGEFEIKALIEKKPEIFVYQIITLVPRQASEIMSLNLDTESSANGISTLEGTLTLSNTKEKTIQLVTSDAQGVFLPEQKKEITLQVDDQGSYTFQVRASTMPGTYFIRASLQDDRNLIIEKPYSLTALRSEDVLNLNLGNVSGIEADGTTIINGTVSINDYLTNGKIILASNLGVFFGSSNPNELTFELLDSEEKDFAFQMSTDPTDHIFTIKLEGTGFEITETLSPVISFPDSLFLLPKSFEIDSASGSVDVDVFLLKESGKASQSIPILMEAHQDQNGTPVEVGNFKIFPLLSNADQKATITFALDTRKAFTNAPIVVTAIVIDDMGQEIKESVSLEVVK